MHGTAWRLVLAALFVCSLAPSEYDKILRR